MLPRSFLQIDKDQAEERVEMCQNLLEYLSDACFICRIMTYNNLIIKNV